MDSQYKIILADDHPILREGLKKLIGDQPELTVSGEAGNGQELLDLLDSGREADLVILDMSMPVMNGIRAAEIIKAEYPEIRILILTMHDDREHFRQAVAAGVEGYMLKEDVYESLITASIREGARAFSPHISEKVLDDIIADMSNPHRKDEEEALSERETEILILVARGLKSRQIAETLNVSARTIETHRARIMSKLKLQNTAAMVKYAVEKGLI